MKIHTDKNGEKIFELCGEPSKGMLALMPGDDEIKFPILIYPDGVGEFVYDFEIQDTNGNWKSVDLRNLR